MVEGDVEFLLGEMEKMAKRAHRIPNRLWDRALEEEKRREKGRKLIPVPEEQKNFIRKTCKSDFNWDEELHVLWEMAMNVVCGTDERFLPNLSDYDFDTEFLSYIRCYDNGRDDIQFMYDSLIFLMYEVIQKGYFELAANIKQAMGVLERLLNVESSSDVLW